jgi:hypothetical protein
VTRALYVLLGAVAAAAAVLSFDALRGLALLCGFARPLAWLLPVVVDAGAAAGSLVWLGGRAPRPARRFARWLALVLLGSSVAANALSHGLAAYGARPAWWVVVLVSGVAPAVLGAVVHLAVLAGRTGDRVNLAGSPRDDVAPSTYEGPEAPADTTAEPPTVAPAVAPAVALHVAGPGDRAAELIAAGYGRRRLAAALEIPEHEAREMLARHREAAG